VNTPQAEKEAIEVLTTQRCLYLYLNCLCFLDYWSFLSMVLLQIKTLFFHIEIKMFLLP